MWADNTLSPDISSVNQSQKIQIKGTVVDELGEPVIGASIIEKGTTNGISSNIDGNFTLNPAQNAVLQISYIGYVTQDITTDNRTSYNIILIEDTQSLNDIVVVGYGTQRKKDLSSAITIVDADSLKRAPVSDFTMALQGLSPGVEVQGNQGRPGELPTIRIRGVSSTNNTDPLYVIDGIPMSSSYINPADVESMQILKDAASSAIYGSRGANGVVIITTKSGKSGTPKIRS